MDSRARIHHLDTLRGFAVTLMIAYHFCFDLDYYGLIDQEFNHDHFWLTARALIVTLFLLVMGASLQLAHRNGIRWRAVARRFALLAGSAALVTLATWLLFPRSYVFFGILHFIALASLLGLLFLHRPKWALVGASAALLVGGFWSHPFFNATGWQWFGLMTHKPVTEDYVPLLPWFGVVLLGMVLGMASGKISVGSLPLPKNGALAWAGRHSLIIYLLHQPLLMGLLFLVTSAGRA
ncbi:MAG TPA: heparan-alpha-glucosaminide N-acetyltransferase [Gammaproteobacteria bacterium]